jgi:hypothetical protein
MATELIVSTVSLATTIQGYLKQAEDLVGQAERAEITTVEQAGRGADFLKIVKGTIKRAEDERKGLLDPYTKRTRMINAEYKKVRDQLDKAVKIAGDKVLDFQLAEEKRQREEAKRIEDEAAERALEAAEQAEESGDAAVADQILELASDSVEEPPRVNPARGDLTGATTSVTKTWTGRVDNIRHVCRAIADGHLPESIIKEFSQTEINKLAREYGERADANAAEVAQYGIVFFEKAGLATR